MDAQKAFRHALGEFPTGVVVVTAVDRDAGPIGMTISSFNSVSVDPQLVLFSIDRRAMSLPILEDASHFGINVLAKDQAELSNAFAKAGTDKWHGVSYANGLGGVPLIDGALAWFECTPHEVFDGGDHRIFVAHVARHSVDPEKKDPLIFCRGRYLEAASALPQN